jgi:hypothetical protein
MPVPTMKQKIGGDAIFQLVPVETVRALPTVATKFGSFVRNKYDPLLFRIIPITTPFDTTAPT